MPSAKTIKSNSFVSWLQLIVSVIGLCYIVVEFHYQVTIPNRPILKVKQINSHEQKKNLILKIYNYGKRPVSEGFIHLYIAPFEDSMPSRDNFISTQTILPEIAAGRFESIGFDLKNTDARLNINKAYVLVMAAESTSLAESVQTDIWYRPDNGTWAPFNGNYAFIDKDQWREARIWADEIKTSLLCCSTCDCRKGN